MLRRIHPEYLAPCVGYCMHHLRQGVKPDDVALMLEGHPEHGHLSAKDRQSALGRALSNVKASDQFAINNGKIIAPLNAKRWKDLF